jgi:sugar lactone lactonase YvrE
MCRAAAWIFVLAALAVSPIAFAAVPAVVASSAISRYAQGMSAPTKVVRDSNGNLFTMDEGNGALVAVPAGTTTPVTLYTGLGYRQALAVDQFNDIIVSDAYSGPVYFFTAAQIASRVAGGSIGTPIDLTQAYGYGTISAYYAQYNDFTVDKNNLVYLALGSCSASCSTTGFAILAVQTSGSTTTTTIAKTGASQVILTNLPTAPESLAVDTSSHLFYADGKNVYEILLTATTKTAVKIGSGFTSPSGVSVDAAGNLYISDSGANNGSGFLYEIPNENGTLNPSDQFIVCSPVHDSSWGVAFDGQGGVYIGDGYARGAIDKMLLGGAAFGSSPVATAAATQTITFAFNASTLVSSVALYQGTGAATEFSNVTGSNCTASTTYTAGSVCSVVLGFTPVSTGVRQGAVVLQSAAGKPLATGYLTGTGSGAALTVDPGTQSSLTALSAWKSPSAVALDGASNIYVADAGANVVQVISSTGVAKATIGSGLSKPRGVAVDGAGNVIISDTGNNRIVEVPNENGTLNTADQVVVVGSGLNAPLGLATGPLGTIYVADSGNSRVLGLSTVAGLGSVAATTVGSGYTTPSAVATDLNGFVYVTDSATSLIYEISPITGAAFVALNSNLYAPTAISIDASGSAYVVNSGNSTVIRVPNLGGSLNPNTLLTLGSLSLLKTPSGVAVNGSGNVAISDSGVPGVFTLVRTTGALLFGAVDTLQSSIAQTLTLTSAGTAPLTLGATAYTPSGATTSFAIASATNNGCTNSSTLATGQTCGYSAVFSPAGTGSLSETLTFSTNAVNASVLSSILSGTGTNLPHTTTVLSVNPTAPYYGEVVQVIATVTGMSTTTPPTGTVTFYVDGIPQLPSSVTSTSPYTATYTFPALSLTASTHTMGAAYSGDANNASSDATPLTLTIAREPSITTAAVTPTVAQPAGSSFSFAVTVSPVAQGNPTTTVNLVAAGTTTPILATAQLKSGSATLIYTPTGGTGTYQYQVLYVGDVNFQASTSNTVNVSIQPVGFTATLPSNSFTVTDGSSIAIPITITGISGYAGNVTVSALNLTTGVITPPCAGQPSNVTCTFSPGIVSLAGGNYPISNPTAVINLTLSTSVPPPTTASGAYLLWPGGIAVLALVLARRKRRTPSLTWLQAAMLCVVLGSLALGVSGCGGSGSSSYATPKGTSTITLTFSGSPVGGYSATPPPYTPNIVNTATFSLTVQ